MPPQFDPHTYQLESAKIEELKAKIGGKGEAVILTGQSVQDIFGKQDILSHPLYTQLFQLHSQSPLYTRLSEFPAKVALHLSRSRSHKIPFGNIPFYKDEDRKTEIEVLNKLRKLCGKKGEETTVTLQHVFDTVGERQFCDFEGQGWILQDYAWLRGVS